MTCQPGSSIPHQHIVCPSVHLSVLLSFITPFLSSFPPTVLLLLSLPLPSPPFLAKKHQFN